MESYQASSESLHRLNDPNQLYLEGLRREPASLLAAGYFYKAARLSGPENRDEYLAKWYNSLRATIVSGTYNDAMRAWRDLSFAAQINFFYLEPESDSFEPVTDDQYINEIEGLGAYLEYFNELPQEDTFNRQLVYGDMAEALTMAVLHRFARKQPGWTAVPSRYEEDFGVIRGGKKEGFDIGVYDDKTRELTYKIQVKSSATSEEYAEDIRIVNIHDIFEAIEIDGIQSYSMTTAISALMLELKHPKNEANKVILDAFEEALLDILN